MIRSPYDGLSRAPLRIGLALFAAADVVWLAALVRGVPPGRDTHPLAPAWLLGLHDRVALLVLLAVLGVGCLAAFALRRATLSAGLLALAVIGLLSESHSALVGGPARRFYVSGAMLLGWLFGVAYARALAARRPGELRTPAAGEERLAELGAVGALAATYAGAAFSKITRGGASWTDVNQLRAIVVSQHSIDDTSLLGQYAHFVASHGRLSEALGVVTVVVQLTAFLMLVSPAWRKVSALGIVAFHVNVLMLAEILYGSNIGLTILFALPWPALVARLRGARPAPVDEPQITVATPASQRRAITAALASIALLVTAGLLPPVRAYTVLHHNPEARERARSARAPGHGRPPPEPVPPEVRAELGGLDVGDMLEGFRVHAIRGTTGADVVVELERGPFLLDLEVVPRGSRAAPAPRSSQRHDLYYRFFAQDTVGQRELDATLDALLARVRAAENPPGG